MTRIDWSGYIAEQVEWARALVNISKDSTGEERRELRRKAESTLVDASEKLGYRLIPVKSRK